MQRFIGIGTVALLVVSSPFLSAQQYEQYQARKESERVRPNRFLYEESPDGRAESRDFLQRYYQSLLLERGKASMLRGGGIEGEGLLKQLKPGISLEGPIDPSKYIVGPLDGISINLWSGAPLSFNTFVTPEGTLIIPTVGEIRVAGSSLKDVKEMVAQQVLKRYNKGDVSVTLVAPRTFVVRVAGVVNRPGAYEVSSVDRVDKAIYLANLLSVGRIEQANPLKEIEQPSSPTYFQSEDLPTERQSSLRNIRLIRSNGDTIQVDLIRFFATGDPTYNPYLLDGDMILVPSLLLSANAVSISGAVRIPGRFEYHRGDSVSLMFKIANGPNADADLGITELVRFGPDGGSLERRIFDAAMVVEGREDFPLQPNDRVLVRWKKNLREEFDVKITGEVRHVGTYAITRESSTLSEVIAQAGGFTSEAALAECKIFRRGSSEDPLASNLDYKRLTEMRLSGMNREDRDYFNYEAAINRGQVSVDFKKLFIDGDKSADVTLRDGDFIVVPSRSRTIYVYGQVVNPGHVTYVLGSDYREYIRKAGGISEAADLGKVSIIKAGTKNWVAADGESVEEGDEIFVGLRPERDLAYYFALARDVLTVATATATIYFLIDQVRK